MFLGKTNVSVYLVLLLSLIGCALRDKSCRFDRIDLKKDISEWSRNSLREVKAAASWKKTAPQVVVGQKFLVHLRPESTVKLLATPQKKFHRPDTRPFAGLLRLKVSKRATYRVSFRERVWIDLVDLSKKSLTASSRHDMQRQCPIVTKAVEFELPPGVHALQISSSKKRKVYALILKVKDMSSRP